MNRRLYFAVILIAALAVGLTACMNDDTLGVQPTPTAAPSYYPSATDGAAGLNGGAPGNGAVPDGTGVNNGGATGNTSSTSNGALGAFDWANGAAEIEKAIGRLSEIAESRVVVTNSTALVAVKFDNAYKGQLTERIREMVAAEVLKADPSIQTVAVTSEAGDVQKVYALSDQIRAGRTADELSREINSIVRNATTLR